MFDVACIQQCKKAAICAAQGVSKQSNDDVKLDWLNLKAFHGIVNLLAIYLGVWMDF